MYFEISAVRASRVAVAAVLGVAILGLDVSSTGARPNTFAHCAIAAKNEPVQSVLRRLASICKENISAAPAVTGYVSVSLRDVTIRQALDAVLGPLGDTWRFHDGLYVVLAGSEATPSSAHRDTAIVPTVLNLNIVPARRAAGQLRTFFPQASIREDERSNAVIVIAPPADVQAMRAVLQGIDVKSPTTPVTEALTLQSMRAKRIIPELRGSFRGATFVDAGEKKLLVTAVPSELAEIKATVNALDATPPSVQTAPTTTEAVRVSQRPPADVARALAHQIHGLRASVAGTAVILEGSSEAVSRAKALVEQIDLPPFDSRYTTVYKIRTLDAGSVADLIRRSFHDVDLTVDSTINAIAITATAALQARIAEAISQLDPAPGAANGIPGSGGFSGGATSELVTLRSAVPVGNGNAADATGPITQALQAIVPDVRVIPLAMPGQLALVGPAPSVRTAHDFIEKVDVVPPLVVLDTEILELDESVAKDLGLQFGSAVISSTFTESTPTPDVNGNQRLGRFQALSRTPIQFTAQLNLLIQNGRGRVLADPRITTISGRTASIRAGDTISILTTTAGNVGTIATTQVQSFQTGVTLDITPLVDADGGVTVYLHPVVNSLAGTNNGVPEISTRDTQTTVHLRDDETLVIGGLIQESNTRTTTKVPIVGDLPLVGRLFRNDQVTGQRNELVIVVTPHIMKPGANALPGPQIKDIPSPRPLPTVPPDMHLAPAMNNRRNPATSITHEPTLIPMTPPAGAPSPAPLPTAFEQTNVFTVGSAPQSNFAKPGDAPQLFYATLSPTVVANGTQISVAAITTTNVVSVKLQVGAFSIALAPTAPGKWRAIFPFPAAAAPVGTASLTATLSAARTDGTAATIAIPLSVSGA